MNQKFGIGDIALLDGHFVVKVVDCIKDEDGSWWYEVKPIDFTPPSRYATREVPQKSLKAI
ncbi:MAG: hypothetical protein J6S67_00585 [Methanobrevibacter sp.]|nr:hypothetical protein [Methanobrevibacter sp.]